MMRPIITFVFICLLFFSQQIVKANENTTEQVKHLLSELRIAQKNNDKDQMSRINHKIGRIMSNQELWTYSYKYYQLSLSQKIEKPVSKKIATIYNLGKAAKHIGEYDEALNLFQQYIEYYQKQSNLEKVVKGMNMQALCYKEKGSLNKAEETLNSALELASGMNKAYVLNNLGEVCFLRGQIEKSITYFEKSLALKVVITTMSKQLSTIGNLGSVYLKQGKLNAAEKVLLQVLDHEEDKKLTFYVDCLKTLDEVYTAKGELEKSKAICRKLVKILEERVSQNKTIEMMLAEANVHLAISEEKLEYSQATYAAELDKFQNIVIAVLLCALIVITYLYLKTKHLQKTSAIKGAAMKDFIKDTKNLD